MTNAKNVTLFNEDIKNDFLNTIQAKQNYRRIFSITSKYETMLNKDVNQFTLKEIEKILFGFKAKSRNTVESYARIISSYLNWCCAKGLIKKNVMEDLKPNDFEKYIYDDSGYLSEKEIEKIEDMLNNYQDIVILRLLFIGAGGKKLSEIRNLKIHDVDFQNKKIRLIESLKEDKKGLPIKYTERYLDVDDRTLNIIEGAINQKVYLKRNGDISTEHDNVSPYANLIMNDYVVRPSITKTGTGNAPVDKFVIYRRLAMIKDVLGLGLDRFNAKFIQQSGMLNYASKIIDGENVSLIDLKVVADRFNIKSYHNLKGLITISNIKKYNKWSWF